MKRKHPFPDGARIEAKFPDGPSGGTWGRTRVQFHVWFDGERVGVNGAVYKTWKSAYDALMAFVEVDGVDEEPKINAAGSPNPVREQIHQVIAEMTAGGNIKGELERAAEDLKARGDHLKGVAERQIEEANALHQKADALSKAAEQL